MVSTFAASSSGRSLEERHVRGVVLAALMLTPVVASSAPDLPDIRVQSQRRQAQIRIDVDRYVSAAILWPRDADRTAQRWGQTPICPMVLGLNQQQGEYVLQRISQIAHQAQARLDTPRCKRPNFSIVVTTDPDGLTRQLNERALRYINTVAGRAALRDFSKPRSVRVWYNLVNVGIDGVFTSPAGYASSTETDAGRPPPTQVLPSQYGSRLSRTLATQDINSVTEIVDRRATLGLTMNQLADYVAVVGLAQIDLDRDFSTAPTILNTFTAAVESKPASATDWDLALLRALYRVKRTHSTALSEVEEMVFASVTTERVP